MNGRPAAVKSGVVWDGEYMADIVINGRKTRVEEGVLLSDVLREEEGFMLPCAGKGRCGKCKVKAVGDLSPLDETERQKLTRKQQENHIRLACRTRVWGACRVEWEKAGGSAVLLGGKSKRDGGRLFDRLGAAVDIGTTTIAAQLYGPSGLLAQAGMPNPQGSYGADVVSRIEKSLAGDAAGLAAAVRDAVSWLLKRLAQTAGEDAAEIDTLVITGNTAMLYFLTQKNPVTLSRAPFLADWLAGEWVRAETLGLICQNARVYFPPCISAFVGADIATALLSVGMEASGRPRLLADIGTNGEIVLWDGQEFVCCSTAAGPAFEGAGLTMGMQGEEGAVCHVELDGDALRVQVIGQGKAQGICGSGVVDAVSCLLQSGRIDGTGYMEEEAVTLSGDVKITQEDIRMVQLAKSAICAGIKTMLRHAGLSVGELEELLVAGGFGSFLNLENAVAIGLLSQTEVSKIRVCGNAALEGAADILWNREAAGRVQKLVSMARTVELASDVYFSDCYMEGMLFEG